MGVMACERNGCDNIMCDHVILNGRYYICSSCLSELQHFKDTWVPPMTEKDVVDKIVEFMCTEKYEECDINKTFERLTDG